MIEFMKRNSSTIELIIGIVFVLVAVGLIILAVKYEKNNKSKASPIRKMTTLSILAALSIVLYYFVKFPLGAILPIPGFLDIHFSNVPILIGGFMFGPISGVIIAVLRFLAKLPQTTTVGVGELMDLFIGVFTVLVASFIYHRDKSKKGAIKALVSVVIVWVFTSIISNWIIIIPLYIALYDFNTVFGMLAIIPGITPDNYMLYYIMLAVIPFNLIISVLVSIVTFLVYKRVSVAYHSIGYVKNDETVNESQIKTL